MIRVGPAGWSYKDWAGIVYPAPVPRGFHHLEFVAGYFDVIEINSTFYGPALRSTAKKWLKQVECNPEFRFTAKIWRRFTHQRTTAWTRAEVREVRAGFDPLNGAGRLGAVLLQFPWSFRNEEQNVEWLDDLLTTFSDFPLAIEVRHTSWDVPEFFRSLAERGVGFVNIDQPLFRDSIAPSALATAPVGYVRVHGRNYRDWWRAGAKPHERYDYLYPAEEIRPWAERAVEIAADPPTEDVFVVTNNHYRGKGVANALMMRSMIEGRKVPAPEPLFGTYGERIEPFALPAPPTCAAAS
jgi:uncharacterized protein YecE (DUF72 family)